jgi:hypothetical protein
MTLSFGVALVSGFPVAPWRTTQQTDIIEDAISTVVEPAGSWNHHYFRKFEVKHEARLHFEGRYHNDPIDSVIRVHRFNVYLDAEGRTAYSWASKKLWHDAFRRMARDQHSALAWEAEEVDLTRLRAALEPRVGGGWFGRLAIARVQTAGIFGPDVASSDEWERYEQLGTLQALSLQLSFEDDDYTLMLVQDGTTVLYTDLGEMKNLAFLLELRRLIQESTR